MLAPSDPRLPDQTHTGVTARDARAVLSLSGLRPTRQRVALTMLLFKGHRHVTAHALHQEARAAGVSLSLATVYNTLHQFTDVGLLRRFAIDGQTTYFDTNADDHHHFYIADEDRIIDIPSDTITFDRLPPPPEGYEVTKVEAVIHLRSNAGG